MKNNTKFQFANCSLFFVQRKNLVGILFNNVTLSINFGIHKKQHTIFSIVNHINFHFECSEFLKIFTNKIQPKENSLIHVKKLNISIFSIFSILQGDTVKIAIDKIGAENVHIF